MLLGMLPHVSERYTRLRRLRFTTKARSRVNFGGLHVVHTAPNGEQLLVPSPYAQCLACDLGYYLVDADVNVGYGKIAHILALGRQLAPVTQHAFLYVAVG